MPIPPPSGSLTVAEDSASGVTYLDGDEVKTVTEAVHEVTASDNEWSDGWYVVKKGTSTIGSKESYQRVAVKGNVNLILEDGCDLTVWGGISVNEGGSLTIYAQSKYDENDENSADNSKVGKLTATAVVDGKAEDDIAGVLDGYAGIGGDRGYSAGSITINGGVVVAVGQGHSENQYKNPDGSYGNYASHGAGIGGGAGGTGGRITINAGKVTATAMGYAGAGIGGGSSASGGDISINGGVVEARAYGLSSEGKGNGAGIGSGGYTSVKGDGAINIAGGTVTAYGSMYGASIGGGANDFGGSISITGGVVNCERESTRWNASGLGAGALLGGSYQGIKGDIAIAGGKVHATGLGSYPAIGGIGAMGNLYILGSADVTAEATGSSGSAIRFPSGSMEISGGTVKATSVNGAGICVNSGSSLLISGGAVTASGGGYGAGIGSANWLLGTIEITGGNVKASSASRSGIGNGSSNGANSGGGSIKISGGNVWAQGASLEWNSYPGIGGGGNSDGAAQPTSIEISGGVVVALGGTRTSSTAGANYAAPGICGAYWKTATPGMNNIIKISGGTVTSIGGFKTTADIGNSVDNDITITGGSVKVRDKSSNIGGMKVTPKDAGGKELVLAKVEVRGSVSSVSVDGVPYDVDGKHPQLDYDTAQDDNLYLYVPTTAKSVAVEDEGGKVYTYALTLDSATNSMGVDPASEAANRDNSEVVFDAQTYLATYGDSSVDVMVNVAEKPVTTRAFAANSLVDLDKVRLTVTNGSKEEVVADEVPVTYADGADSTAKSEAKFSLDISKLPVGTYTLKASYGGSANLEASAETTATLTVNPKTLSVMDIAAVERPYDGTKKVALSGGTLDGVLPGDDVVAVMPTGGTLKDANSGENKTVDIPTIELSGKDKGNYDLTQPTGVTVNITKAIQELSYAQAKVSKYLGDEAFTNKLTTTSVYGTVTYVSSNPKVATVDPSTGEVTIVDTGTTTIKATAVGDATNYDEATASYELTVSSRSAVTPSSPQEITVSKLGRGTVSLSGSSARKGDTVTITVTPDEGFSVQSVSATDANGAAVAVTKAANGTYTFVMPDAAVSVSVTFAKTLPTAFTDVDETQWYAAGVKFVSQAGIMNGYSDAEGKPTGIFGVGKVLTRAEFAGLLFNYAGGTSDTAAKNETGLPDVADGAWYTSAANWAVEKGIIHGSDHADGTVTFDPNSPVTLEQMVAILSRIAGADISKANASTLAQYKDASAVSGWATQAVAWGSEVGLFSGSVETDGRYIRPTQDIMRERVAAVMMNAYTKGVLK